MSRSSSRRRAARAFAALLLTVGPVLASSALAGASDQGSWAGSCYDRGRGCRWKGDINQSFVLGSPTRDSSFGNDYYYEGSGGILNDNVRYVTNSFSTIRIRAYHHSNYVTGSTCIGGGVSIGPYVTGSSYGISSFKSC